MKKLVLLVILGTVATASVWSWKRTSEPVATDNKLIADRIWLDHLPRNDRDTVNVFAMLSEHSVGVFQATSQWRGNFEVFRYEASGGELRMVFPQTGDREKARTKARRCNEGQMDFCLEIDGASKGVKKYYSREGWELGGQDMDSVKHRVDRLVEQLETAAATE